MLSEYSFDAGILRLKGAFGERAISNEKKLLLYDRVKHLDQSDWGTVVDQIILNKRQVPVWDDFKEIIDSQKNKTTKIENKEFKSVLSNEERSELFSILKKASSGLIRREDVKKYSEMLAKSLEDRVVKVEPYKRYDSLTGQWLNDNWGN